MRYNTQDTTQEECGRAEGWE